MQIPRIGFFVIGAARSGTTSLYRVLAQHPDVFTPEVKEPRFFAENWRRGWKWYNDIYAAAPDGAILGDFSPNYTNAPDENRVVPRMAQFYPEARLIYMVRNPIACAISNWRMTAELTGETIPFGEALEGEWALTVYHRACFFRQISHFRKAFADEQILAVPLETLRSDPAAWLSRIYSHIGARPVEAVFPKANASDRKPERPGIPEVSPKDRRRFLELVADDARAMLDHMGLPHSLWALGPNAREWGQAPRAA